MDITRENSANTAIRGLPPLTNTPEIVIFGNICAGKTTFAKLLANAIGRVDAHGRAHLLDLDHHRFAAYEKYPHLPIWDREKIAKNTYIQAYQKHKNSTPTPLILTASWISAPVQTHGRASNPPAQSLPSRLSINNAIHLHPDAYIIRLICARDAARSRYYDRKSIPGRAAPPILIPAQIYKSLTFDKSWDYIAEKHYNEPIYPHRTIDTTEWT